MGMDSTPPQLPAPLVFVSHQVYLLYLPLPLYLSLSQSVSLNVNGAGWHNPHHEIFRVLRERLGTGSLTLPSLDFPFFFFFFLNLLNLYLLWRVTAAFCRPAALLRGLATVLRPFLLTHAVFFPWVCSMGDDFKGAFHRLLQEILVCQLSEVQAYRECSAFITQTTSASIWTRKGRFGAGGC